MRWGWGVRVGCVYVLVYGYRRLGVCLYVGEVWLWICGCMCKVGQEHIKLHD